MNNSLAWTLVTFAVGLYTNPVTARAQATHDISALKAQIIAISVANQNRTDNYADVRAALDPLIAELLSKSPSRTQDEIAQLNVGAWHQLWTDNVNIDPPGFTSNLAQIYQVVSPQAFLYNFGARTVDSTGEVVVFMLRGVLTLSGNVASVELTNAFSRPYAITSAESLPALADAIEAGTAKDVVSRPAGNFPRGPIGAKSDITLSYIDADLRITYANNSFTNSRDLFVVQRW